MQAFEQYLLDGRQRLAACRLGAEPVRPDAARRDELRRHGVQRAHLNKPCQPPERPIEILRQVLEAQKKRIRSRRRVPGQHMATPGAEMVAGNDCIEIDIVARGSQEFPQAAAAITAVAHDIDRLAIIDRPFMGFYQRQSQKIWREPSVGSPLEMADTLRYDQVARQSSA
jgi:hypothetical protein